MQIPDRLRQITKNLIPSSPFRLRQSPSRREFLGHMASVSSAVVLGPVVGLSGIDPKELRLEEHLQVEGEFDYLRNPIKLIDQIIERIRQKNQSELFPGEKKFLSLYQIPSIDSQVLHRRQIFESVYTLFSEKIILLLERRQASNLTGEVLMYNWYDPFFSLHQLLHSPDQQSALVGDWIIDELDFLVQWLTPMTKENGYGKQKKAYLTPREDSPQRLIEQEEERLLLAARYVRGGKFDPQWTEVYFASKDEMVPPEWETAFPQQEEANEYVRLVSQKDELVMEAALRTLDQLLPGALRVLNVLRPALLTSYKYYRANYQSFDRSVRLGQEGNRVAEALYAFIGHKKHEKGLRAEDELILDSDAVSEFLIVVFHEVFHPYDLNRSEVLWLKHPHPKDMLEYQEAYIESYESILRFFDNVMISESGPNKQAFSRDDFDVLFAMNSLPVFGLDELDPLNPELVQKMRNELETLRATVSQISNLGSTKLRQTGLDDLFVFHPNGDPWIIWQQMFDSQTPHTGGLVDESLVQPIDITKTTDMSYSWLSNLIVTYDTVIQKIQDFFADNGTKTDEQYLQRGEQMVFIQNLLKIKSHYQLLCFVTLFRLKHILTQDEFHSLEGSYYHFHSLILSQIGHAFVGPAGVYIPPWNLLDQRSLSKSQDQQIESSLQRWQQLAVHKQARLLKASGKLYGIDKAFALTKTLYTSQLKTVSARVRMLGADLGVDQLKKKLEQGEEITQREYLLVFDKALDLFSQEISATVGNPLKPGQKGG